jgi:thymidylate synthase
MSKTEKAYLDLIREVKEKGVRKSDRTGTGTVSIFGRTLRFDMREGFPLLTTKKIHHKAVVHELLWFLQGGHNIKYLVDNGVSIWNEWPWKAYMDEHENRKTALNISIDRSDIYDDTPFAVKHMKARLDEHPALTLPEFVDKIKNDDEFAKVWGELGPVYGKQWRQWQGWMEYGDNGQMGSLWFDQILTLLNDLRHNPDSRRLMVNAWNVAEIDKMLLPPCHYGFQCWTRELTFKERRDLAHEYAIKNGLIPLAIHAYGDKGIPSYMDAIDATGWNIPKRGLSLMWQQRSVDMFLGLPFDLASYGLLLSMLAQCTNMVAEELVFNGGDCHVYSNHFDQVDELLSREPMPLCKLELARPANYYGSGVVPEPIESYKYEDIKFVGYTSHPAIKAPVAI